MKPKWKREAKKARHKACPRRWIIDWDASKRMTHAERRRAIQVFDSGVPTINRRPNREARRQIIADAKVTARALAWDPSKAYREMRRRHELAMPPGVVAGVPEGLKIDAVRQVVELPEVASDTGRSVLQSDKGQPDGTVGKPSNREGL